MELNDPRWLDLRGGHRMPYDPRPALRDLAAGRNATAAWAALWENLYHQDDVGEASYAAVPEIVRIYSHSPNGDWNAYAIVASIEAVRPEPSNPPIPDWLRADYDSALRSLFEIAVRELPAAQGDELTRSLIAVIALSKGQRSIAQIAFLTEDERQEFLGF